MELRLANFVIALALFAQGAVAVDTKFIERFALADTAQRERLLDELIGGTEDSDYFHSLHYQNTRNTAALDSLLAAWRERNPKYSERRQQIQLREAVLRYGDDTENSLLTLREYFGFFPDELRPPLGADIAQDELLSKLDPADISAAAFLNELANEPDPFSSISKATATWIIATGQEIPEGLNRRRLLKLIDRPDIPNLLEAVRKDLVEDSGGSFGTQKIHRKLLLPQLDTLAEQFPVLLAKQSYVHAYLAKLRPSKMEAGSEIERREAFLKRATDFADRLPPSMAATRAHLLYHWLKIDLQRGRVDRERLLRYLKTPRQADYMNGDYLRECDNRFRFPEIDLSEPTGLPKLPKTDEPLVRDLLLTLFKTDPDTEVFAPYLNAIWLREVQAEAQVLAGKGDPERHFSVLGASAYQKLLERIDIHIAKSNPTRLAPNDDVVLRVDVKNVPELSVKVFEINAFNYFRQIGSDLDPTINLDGLIPTNTETHEFDTPPAQRVTREFSFPQLKGKRGAWVIEFIGNGTSSRALIRKGELHAIPRSTSVGHAFRVFDVERELVKTATLWLDGHEFSADEETGDIVVPYSAKPGRASFIVTDGALAQLDHFEHEAERYQLEAGIFVDRESLIAGNTAHLIARPSLTINGARTDFSLLEEVVLSITSRDQDGTQSVLRREGIQLSPNSELVHEFVVPERLEIVEISLEGKVESLSTQERVTVTAVPKRIAVNHIDRSDLISSTHLLKTGDDYVIEVLGRNGEAQAGKLVEIVFNHGRFEKARVLNFKSDATGRIFLGELPDIFSIVTEVDGATHLSVLGDRLSHLSEPRRFHITAGETATIPSASGAVELDWEHYSLVEMRGGLPVRNWFSALAVDGDGTLTITGLPAGEYHLNANDGFSKEDHSALFPGEFEETTAAPDRTIFVSAGASAEIIATDDQFLEHSATNQKPLGLTIDDLVAGKLWVKVTNPNKRTRVHITASHFVPAFSFAWQLSDKLDHSPRSHPILRAGNSYVSGREIGDEYRYILERRRLPKFPGNQLPRPGSILNPWNLGDSRSNGQSGKVIGFFGEDRKRQSARRSGDDWFGGGEFPLEETSHLNLDFLTLHPRSFYNLKPDQNGLVEIDMEKLGSARFISAVAIDGTRIASRERAFPEVRLGKRDRRLQKADQLDPQARLTQTRDARVMQAGEELQLDRANAARFQIYDDLGDVFQLLSALADDESLEKFSFVLGWPELDEAEKRKLYSEFACHELNLFLSQHDEKFFAKKIRPFLRNKLEKDFIDHYLLGDDLARYLEEWRLVRLNAAERALLAQWLGGEEKEHTVSALVARFEAEPVDYARDARLFAAAQAGNRLSTGDPLHHLAGPVSMGSGGAAPDYPLDSIRQLLKETIVREIDFTEATIDEAIAFLRKQAPSINMVIKGSDGERIEASPINLQLADVPLEDALKFTTELAGLKYRLEQNAVIIVPGYEEGGQLITQSFRVPPDFLRRDVDGREVASAREFLESVGVPFPEGSSAAFIGVTSELVVRNTASNIDLIRVFTDSLADYPPPGLVGGVVSGDDPFGGGGGGGGFGSGILMRSKAPAVQFYRKLGDTEELAETHYYRLPMKDQKPERVPINAFWRDYATWDGDGSFLSPHFAEASTNFTEAMLALALLDLPFTTKKSAAITQRTITANSPAIIFAEQIKPAALEVGDVVIGQKFYPLAQPTRLVRGERVPGYIDADFVIGTGYGAHVVVTNPTGRHLHFDLLRQLPQGSIPLNGSPITHTGTINLKPYSTQKFTMGFYFPTPGTFAQYPSQASAGGKVIATTPIKIFEVAPAAGEVDATSWTDLAARGSSDAVLTFLLTQNLNHYPLDLIKWRMKDEFFFATAIEILRERQIYQHEIYAFGLMHHHPEAARQFLLNSSQFLQQIGNTIESELLTVSPSERHLYQHLEYEPSINARRHQLGGEPRIVNEQFRAQHDRFMAQLSHKSAPDNDDLLSIVYYLLLQDRIDGAIATFDKIDAHVLETQLQYDYFRCYLSFYREQVDSARAIALKYKDHPVDRWRQMFAKVVSQADEINSAAQVKVDDPRDREQSQDKLAATSRQLDLAIKDGQLIINHRNLASVEMNYYKMDLEFLFSANPFVQSDIERFRFIKPNLSLPLRDLDPSGKSTFPLLEAFRNENVLVEVVGGGQSKTQTYFANDLDVVISKNYGRLQVARTTTSEPFPKTYIKVYARMFDGEVKFYKDGYTDLRGRFEYASLSANDLDLDKIDRFAILLMHEESGAAVEEVTPPNHRPRPEPTPKPEPVREPESSPGDDPFSDLLPPENR